MCIRDSCNTRDIWGKLSKEPIKLSNLNECQGLLQTYSTYLSGLKIEDIEILKHAPKTFVLGFFTNINSIKILNNRLLNELSFSYILTYKFPQDHLELLFSCIRARGGHNNNPNVSSFSTR